MNKRHIQRIIALLVGEYGEQRWQPDHKPVATLIQTILSQHTSDINSHRTFHSLGSAFSSWEDIADADIANIAFSIRGGGLGEIKAKRIKQALNEIRLKRGRIELDFLNQLSTEGARDWLKQLPGVGTKTANCVLLFSLGKPALPVDTHIFRVSRRLGLIDNGASVEKAHLVLENLIPAEDAYTFHVLMIEHGRKVCQALRPRCPECVLRKLCPGYEHSGENGSIIS
ncbi:MAG: endonuclease III [Chloroflexi bacterium]|nr:endonuclease III [Chloroflexota bacterium]